METVAEAKAETAVCQSRKGGTENRKAGKGRSRYDGEDRCLGGKHRQAPPGYLRRPYPAASGGLSHYFAVFLVFQYRDRRSGKYRRLHLSGGGPGHQQRGAYLYRVGNRPANGNRPRSEEHTSELQSQR